MRSSPALAVDAVLRSQGVFAPERPSLPWRLIAVMVAIGGFSHGLVIGSYGGRPLQMIYSGLKLPLMLATATLVALPSFIVANAALGLSRDLIRAIRAVIASQAVMVLALVSLAPVVGLAYVSTGVYRDVMKANGAVFLTAAILSQVSVRRHYRPLLALNPRHRVALWLWSVLYAGVAIQAAWVLRPFVGSPGLPTRFLRENAFTNAYIEIYRLVVGL